MTDEVMVVALSVGTCPGGALAALKGLLERPLENGFHHQKGFRRPFFSDLKALSHSERGVQNRKSAVLRYVWVSITTHLRRFRQSFISRFYRKTRLGFRFSSDYRSVLN